MKGRFSLMAVAAAVLFVSIACAIGGRSLKIAQGWVGSDISSCIMKWGQPTNTFRLQDGSVMYTWHEVSSVESVRSGNGSLLFPYKVTTVEKYCDWTMTANRSGTIIYGKTSGNACY